MSRNIRSTKAVLTAIVLILAVRDFATAQDAATSSESQSPLLTAEDGKTAQLAVKAFSQRHLQHPVIDDVLSEKLMAHFVQSCDPQKLYFLRPDIAEFETQKTQLDDQLLAGNVQFANAVFQRFQQRAAERINRVSLWIDAVHDFSVDESLTTDATELDWAATAVELDERWRTQVKYGLLLLKLKGYDDAECRLRLRRHHERTQTLLNQTERYELLEQYLTSITKCFDPRAEFLSEETMATFRGGMLRLYGIGVLLKEQDGYLVVQEILEGGPAATDGRIQSGDCIIGVAEGDAQRFVDLWHMKLKDIYKPIAGSHGTTVKVQVLKKSGDIEVYKLKRAGISTINSNDELRSCILKSPDWIDGTNSSIGVLSIPKFTRDFRGASLGKEFDSTARDVRKVLERWNAANVDVIMIDLRGNSSGAFAEALDLFRLFAGKGPVGLFSETDEPVTSWESEDPVDPEICWKKPLVIICDRKTSGSAEVFSAAIQDYQRGIVIGDASTHGKGTVQNVINVRADTSLFSATFGSIKCTITALFRVTGNSIQHAGVTSDIVLPSLSEVLNTGEESLENAMKFDPIPPANYTHFTTYVGDSIIAETSERSKARVLNSPDFQIVEVQIQRHVKRTNEKSVSLNQTVAESRMKELNADEGLARQIVSNRAGGEVFPRNYYNIELVHIATDYVQLLKAM